MDTRPNTATNRNRLAKWIRLSAQLISLGEVVFLLVAGYVAYGLGGIISTDVVLIGVAIILALVGCLIARRLEWVAGILLIVIFSGLVFSAIIMYGLTRAFWPWSPLGSGLPIFGSPLFLAGILFLVSSWLSRKSLRSV